MHPLDLLAGMQNARRVRAERFSSNYAAAIGQAARFRALP
jgi:hypothetical protein